ncbi:hypothetical protein EU508_06375 [Pseudoalteromonas fuliginea]|uniref:Polysaccharide biosynthesis protein C-terminal domain-containing protein n=1 Tax=Pseudoalteromonas fuliginea TaxID=1872678 RepID=A0AB73BIN6_9GAMM|nr:oligosaccharide flippase family protein [Pseudoalteromonas fuliginea]KAA1162032.1 hypothetical protein EU508_06375 [Pseudoalteromonas fuliginea]
MNLKKIFSFSAVYALLAGLEKAAMLLLLPIITTHLTTFQYGVVSTIVMITSFLASLIALSLHGALFRYYHRYGERIGKVLISTLLIFLISLSFISIVLIIVFGWFYSFSYETELPFTPYWFFISIISASSAIISFTFNVFKITENRNVLVKLSVFKLLLITALIVFFIVGMGLADIGYLWGMSISVTVIAFMSVMNIFIKYGMKFEIRILKKSLTYSLPIVPISISNILSNLIDRFYIIQYLGVASVGVYYLGIQITSIILMIMQAINSAYTPMFFRQVRGELDKMFYFYSELYISVSLLLSVLIYIISSAFINNYLPQEYSDVLKVLPIFFIIATVNSLYVLNTNLLSLRRNLVKVKTYIVTIGLFINISFGWYFTSSLGMLGAALSSLISCLVIVLLFMYFNNRNNNIFYSNYKHLFLLGVNSAVLLMLGYFFSNFALKLFFSLFYSLCFLSYLYINYKKSINEG